MNSANASDMVRLFTQTAYAFNNCIMLCDQGKFSSYIKLVYIKWKKKTETVIWEKWLVITLL